VLKWSRGTVSAVGRMVSYVQALYGVAPRWQVGLRHEVVGLKNELMEGLSISRYGDSQRTSLVLSYRPNAAYPLRLQLSLPTFTMKHGDKTRSGTRYRWAIP
jgi:hypothetical protein